MNTTLSLVETLRYFTVRPHIPSDDSKFSQFFRSCEIPSIESHAIQNLCEHLSESASPMYSSYSVINQFSSSFHFSSNELIKLLEFKDDTLDETQKTDVLLIIFKNSIAFLCLDEQSINETYTYYNHLILVIKSLTTFQAGFTKSLFWVLYVIVLMKAIPKIPITYHITNLICTEIESSMIENPNSLLIFVEFLKKINQDKIQNSKDGQESSTENESQKNQIYEMNSSDSKMESSNSNISKDINFVEYHCDGDECHIDVKEKNDLEVIESKVCLSIQKLIIAYDKENIEYDEVPLIELIKERFFKLDPEQMMVVPLIAKHKISKSVISLYEGLPPILCNFDSDFVEDDYSFEKPTEFTFAEFDFNNSLKDDENDSDDENSKEHKKHHRRKKHHHKTLEDDDYESEYSDLSADHPKTHVKNSKTTGYFLSPILRKQLKSILFLFNYIHYSYIDAFFGKFTEIAHDSYKNYFIFLYFLTHINFNHETLPQVFDAILWDKLFVPSVTIFNSNHCFNSKFDCYSDLKDDQEEHKERKCDENDSDSETHNKKSPPEKPCSFCLSSFYRERGIMIIIVHGPNYINNLFDHFKNYPFLFAETAVRVINHLPNVYPPSFKTRDMFVMLLNVQENLLKIEEMIKAGKVKSISKTDFKMATDARSAIFHLIMKLLHSPLSRQLALDPLFDSLSDKSFSKSMFKSLSKDSRMANCAFLVNMFHLLAKSKPPHSLMKKLVNQASHVVTKDPLVSSSLLLALFDSLNSYPNQAILLSTLSIMISIVSKSSKVNFVHGVYSQLSLVIPKNKLRCFDQLFQLLSASNQVKVGMNFIITRPSFVVTVFSVFLNFKEEKLLFNEMSNLCDYSNYNCLQLFRGEADLLLLAMIYHWPDDFMFRDFKIRNIKEKHKLFEYTIPVFLKIAGTRSSEIAAEKIIRIISPHEDGKVSPIASKFIKLVSPLHKTMKDHVKTGFPIGIQQQITEYTRIPYDHILNGSTIAFTFYVDNFLSSKINIKPTIFQITVSNLTFIEFLIEATSLICAVDNGGNRMEVAVAQNIPTNKWNLVTVQISEVSKTSLQIDTTIDLNPHTKYSHNFPIKSSERDTFDIKVGNQTKFHGDKGILACIFQLGSFAYFDHMMNVQKFFEDWLESSSSSLIVPLKGDQPMKYPGLNAITNPVIVSALFPNIIVIFNHYFPPERYLPIFNQYDIYTRKYSILVIKALPGFYDSKISKLFSVLPYFFVKTTQPITYGHYLAFYDYLKYCPTMCDKFSLFDNIMFNLSWWLNINENELQKVLNHVSTKMYHEYTEYFMQDDFFKRFIGCYRILFNELSDEKKGENKRNIDLFMDKLDAVVLNRVKVKFTIDDCNLMLNSILSAKKKELVEHLLSLMLSLLKYIQPTESIIYLLMNVPFGKDPDLFSPLVHCLKIIAPDFYGSIILLESRLPDNFYYDKLFDDVFEFPEMFPIAFLIAINHDKDIQMKLIDTYIQFSLDDAKREMIKKCYYWQIWPIVFGLQVDQELQKKVSIFLAQMFTNPFDVENLDLAIVSIKFFEVSTTFDTGFLISSIMNNVYNLCADKLSGKELRVLSKRFFFVMYCEFRYGSHSQNMIKLFKNSPFQPNSHCTIENHSFDDAIITNEGLVNISDFNNDSILAENDDTFNNIKKDIVAESKSRKTTTINEQEHIKNKNDPEVENNNDNDDESDDDDNDNESDSDDKDDKKGIRRKKKGFYKKLLKHNRNYDDSDDSDNEKLVESSAVSNDNDVYEFNERECYDYFSRMNHYFMTLTIIPLFSEIKTMDAAFKAFHFEEQHEIRFMIVFKPIDSDLKSTALLLADKISDNVFSKLLTVLLVQDNSPIKTTKPDLEVLKYHNSVITPFLLSVRQNTKKKRFEIQSFFNKFWTSVHNIEAIKIEDPLITFKKEIQTFKEHNLEQYLQIMKKFIFSEQVLETMNENIKTEYSRSFRFSDNFNTAVVKKTIKHDNKIIKKSAHEKAFSKQTYIISSWVCLKISINSQKKCMFYVTRNKIIIVIEKRKKVELKASEITHILTRNRLQRPTAIEFFTESGSSYLLDFAPVLASEIMKKLESIRMKNLIDRENSNFAEFILKKDLLKNWEKGKITNYEFLMKLNMFTGRSFKDTENYMIFPFVQINEKKIRDFSLPMPIQDPKRLAHFFQSAEMNHFMFGSAPSNSMLLSYYFLRLEPYTSLHKAINDGHFDIAGRLFNSYPQFMTSLVNGDEWKECSPEFYSFPEIFMDLNNVMHEALDIARSESMNIKMRMDEDMSRMDLKTSIRKSFIGRPINNDIYRSNYYHNFNKKPSIYNCTSDCDKCMTLISSNENASYNSENGSNYHRAGINEVNESNTSSLFPFSTHLHKSDSHLLIANNYNRINSDNNNNNNELSAPEENLTMCIVPNEDNNNLNQSEGSFEEMMKINKEESSSKMSNSTSSDTLENESEAESQSEEGIRLSNKRSVCLLNELEKGETTAQEIKEDEECMKKSVKIIKEKEKERESKQEKSVETHKNKDKNIEKETDNNDDNDKYEMENGFRRVKSFIDSESDEGSFEDNNDEEFEDYDDNDDASQKGNTHVESSSEYHNVNGDLSTHYNSVFDFIYNNRKVLESEYVSSHLGEWIDMIWGISQHNRGGDIWISYLYNDCWSKFRESDKESERSVIPLMLSKLGSIPPQVFFAHVNKQARSNYSKYFDKVSFREGDRESSPRMRLTMKTQFMNIMNENKSTIYHGMFHVKLNKVKEQVKKTSSKMAFIFEIDNELHLIVFFENGLIQSYTVDIERKEIHPFSPEPLNLKIPSDSKFVCQKETVFIFDQKSDKIYCVNLNKLITVDVKMDYDIDFACGLAKFGNTVVAMKCGSLSLWNYPHLNFTPLPCINMESISAMTVNTTYRNIVYCTNDGYLRTYSVSKKKILNSVKIDCIAEKILTTKNWAFVIVYAPGWLYLFNINGLIIKSLQIDFEIYNWCTFSDHKGFDYVCCVDPIGYIYTFEAYYIENVELIAGCHDRIISLYFYDSYQCIVACSSNSKVYFISYNII